MTSSICGAEVARDHEPARASPTYQKPVRLPTGPRASLTTTLPAAIPSADTGAFAQEEDSALRGQKAARSSIGPRQNMAALLPTVDSGQVYTEDVPMVRAQIPQIFLRSLVEHECAPLNALRL